ncbi:DNA topoisomerase IB [Paramicrobacterium agarici]|uniref:DNA topoisomerase n=1 Tax=Paramicrobacterium agarici TaxID=630514 RepID=A0A2A9DRG7_9MICO|nr:DNA topoisomerase IB [Microbacterium agarici]PFG29278.1 DNA topoisomerase-1 [Microbacterium agarici]TQO22227.1 DNA topoisomerase-1 [Microbacterium agarici]
MVRLRIADTSSPGWTLATTSTGPVLVDARGRRITDAAALTRVADLVIPPAWTDLWIAPQPNAHIQAVGTDAAGRRQYLYHEQWHRQKKREKYDRMLELAASLPSARSLVTRDLQAPYGSRERVLAASFRLLDNAYLRVGSERYAQRHGSRGLTTLLGQHATVSGDTVILDFVGKSGMAWGSQTTDAALASAVRSLKRRGGNERLFAWRDGVTWHPVTPSDVNEYVRERTHGDFTAKDFRTLHGSTSAAAELASLGIRETAAERKRTIAEAVTRTADILGNTPAVARSSYIDPRIIDRYRDGYVLQTGRISPERALRALIMQHEGDDDDKL